MLFIMPVLKYRKNTALLGYRNGFAEQSQAVHKKPKADGADHQEIGPGCDKTAAAINDNL